MSKAVMVACWLTTACATAPAQRPWGEPATVRPGWQRLRQAAVQAAKSPWTWAPVTAAAALQIDDLDHELADWAADTTPLFGDQKTAEDWSDYFKAAATVSYFATAIAAPSGTKPGEWWRNKASGLAVGWAAAQVNTALTNFGKSEVDRLRPDGSERRSFPSGHASSSTLRATLAADNLESMRLSRGSRRALGRIFAGFAAASSWARVEAQKHFPSDVLAGTALGHFLGAFFREAFPVSAARVGDLQVRLGREEIYVAFRWAAGDF